MKRTFTTLLILLAYTFASGYEWIPLNSSEPSPAKIELNYSDINRSRISVSIDGYYQQAVNTNRGEAFVIGLPGASPILEKGAPDLPKLTTSLIIPDQARMEVNVLSSKFKVYKNIEIAPSKGNFTRDIDPSDVPFEYGDVYSINADFPTVTAKLRDPYIVRDYRGQTIIIQPFTYNPVTRELKVYYELEIEIKKRDKQGINPLVRKKAIDKVESQFGAFYQRHFLNINSSRYDPVDEEGCMLIISYGDFIPAMQDFKEWKLQTGREVEIVDVADIGGTSQIKTYIADYYDTHDLAYVLLVGDAAQVPTSQSNGDSDNDYVYILGNDHYPDAFIGRFSAENVQQVETQVERSIAYEKNPYTGQDWFTIGTGISSDQGPGDDGEYDYEHIRNIHDDLMDYTYTYCHELFDGSQGGLDEPGNPTPTMVGQAINDGTSIINYTGHGSSTSWGSSGFSNGNINNLTNTDMLPFIWSVACVNGDFVGNTCFAEAWLRAEDNGEPTGAVATLMSTINQSWNPPMHGQDAMVDILVESFSDNIKRTFGGLSMNGCMEMNDEYGSQGADMTDTWTLFGDPSLMVRTAMPQAITATYQPTLFLGQSELSVTSNAEGGMVVLLKDGSIFAKAEVVGGEALLTFEELTDVGSLDITITCYNYVPHINEIQVVPANTPYLIYESHVVTDTANNGNHIIEPGEMIYLTIDMKNVGGVDAEDVDVEIIPDCDYINTIDMDENYGLIPAESIKGIENAFCFDVDPYAPDQTPIPIEIIATDSEGETWISSIDLKICAPILSVGNMIVDDSQGNDNGRLDPGETVILNVKNYNIGHSIAYEGVATINSSSQYIEFTSDIDSVGTVGMLGSTTANFEIYVDEEAPIGVVDAVFEYEIVAGLYQASKTFTEEIGLLYEDFETGNFTKFDWQFDGDQPWQISISTPYEGMFCAESAEIGDGESTEIKITHEIMFSDSISFYKRVSSDPDDRLKFYINGTMKGQWSGIGEGYSREAFAVGPGMKTFRWVYEKSSSGSQGGDYAKIDYIVFPPVMQLMVTAGANDYVCAGNDYQCQGEAYDYTSLEWTTSGSGTFNDNSIIDPIYTPSSEDISNASVELTLTAWNSEGESVDDELILDILDKPAQASIPVGPEYVDVLSTPESEYMTEEVEMATEYVWELLPAEAGAISGITTQAMVEWNQDYLGTALIKVKAVNECQEGIWSEELEVVVDNATVIQEVGDNYSLKIFPNPASDAIKIELGTETSEIVRLALIDAYGKLMKVHEIHVTAGFNSTVLDISELPDGMYFLRITGSNSQVKKIIKK